MFSSIMESVLTKFLGKYVDGIKNNMDINIITGNATIQKISLRPEFINELGLPFLLKYSHISKILINVPWASLKEKPATVTIQGIYVLLLLKYDDLEEILVDPQKKMKSIVNRVKQEIKKKWQQKESDKKQTFAEKSIIRIIDNLIVSIDEIHVRVESMKRNWDFSFGVIMDKISSFTVNQYGQKTFYTRHFTDKELNQPLKKTFVCSRFQIYFNDKEDFFFSQKEDKKNEAIKALLMEPFSAKSGSPNKKKQNTPQKAATLQVKQSYKMKNLTRFSFDIIAQQKFSQQKKYIVQVKGQLPKVNFQITDIQLSQILLVCQLIYQWIIDKEKNGRRNNIFDEKVEAEFKRILLKLSKEQKLPNQQMEYLYNIALETPVDKLENAADNLIREYRIEKEMKKINKAANKQKSKEMIQKLFERIENQNQEVLELFEHIIIQLNVPEFKLTCMREDAVLLEVGVSSIGSEIKLVLTKHTLITVKVLEPFVKLYNEEEVKDLVILNEQQYMKQPFIEFSLTLLNKSPPIIKTNMKKRYILLDETTLTYLLFWLSCIKIKPPLVNFLDEQLNYSIHITQQIFYALFGHKDLSISINLQIPVLAVQLRSLLQANWGTMLINRESEEQYSISISEKQSFCVNGQEIIVLDEGNRISLLNIKPQTVKVEIVQLHLKNINKVFKFISEFLKSPLVKEIKKLEPIVEEEIIFQGKFVLNQYIVPQNMMLKGNYLKFFPSGDSIYLLRTKMYPFVKKGKYGLIFRQQVQKTINIVLMTSQKLMYTLFETIKQHMLYICTMAQWKKYYQKFPNTLITEVSQIQKQEQNTSLIDLHIVMNSADIYLLDSKLGKTILNISQFKGSINYKEYNTDAKGDIGSMNLTLGEEKLIQNLAVGVDYSYKDYMNLLINVLAFRLNIETYEIIEQIINISAQYSLMVSNLLNSINEIFGMPPENYMLQKIQSQQDISYLLERKTTIKLSNIEVFIIGFRNMVKHSNIDISKYRNNPIPNILLKLKQAVIMSSVTLSQCEVVAVNNKIDVLLSQLAINLSFQLVFYELTSGRGHNFINSVMQVLESRKSQQVENSGERALPTVGITVKGFKTRFRLTQKQQISTHTREIVARLSPNQTDHNFIDLNTNWTKMSLIINRNIILEPISGKVNIKFDSKFTPTAINSQVQPILINISVHKLIESAIIIKLSLQRILNIDLIKSLLTESLKANNPRLSKKTLQPRIQLLIDCVQVLLFNYQDWPLLRFKIDSTNLDTEKGKENEVEVSLEHLNYGFRIYEPVLEKTKIYMCIKQGPQACIRFADLRFNISEQFVKDLIRELIITKKNIDRSLKQIKLNDVGESSKQNQLEKYKSIIISMILPQGEQEMLEQQQQELKMQQTQQQKSNTSTLFIRNHLKTEVFVQVKIDQKKTQVHLKTEEEQGHARFKVRSQYRQSFEMVQKYKQIIIKLSISHPIFYTQALYFSVFLHKTAYNYHQAKFCCNSTQEIESGIGIYIHQQENSINYILDIISPYKITNTTSINLNLNWMKGEDHYHRQLKQGQSEWVSSWINQKVTINPNSDHLYASSYQVMFDQPHGLYEINLSNSVGSQVVNFCCLTIEKELFQLEKWHKQNNESKKKKPIQPATMVIKPTYFVINHFHFTISINQIQCKHKEKVPLYSMFRTKKSESFFKLKLGDGSMHEVYLPKDGQSNTVQLKLKNQNYVNISILREKSLQGTNKPNSNQCIYHVYGILELLISFPRVEQLVLRTNIFSTRYILKKEIELNQIGFEHRHPAIVSGNELAITRDRFNFHTSAHVIGGQNEKYLEIKSPNFYSKEVTLYPSYFGTDFLLFKPEPVNQKEPLQQVCKKYSINYQFTKINNDITMYYVSILPKYYILNLSSQTFNIDGQGSLKFNERIVIDSDQVEIMFMDYQTRWEMLHNSLVVNLSAKKQIMFFRQVYFKQFQINSELKNKKRRKSSEDMSKVMSESTIKKSAALNNQKMGQKSKSITISTENIKVFQIVKHIGTYSATTFCLNQWNQWIKIHNNLNKTIVALTTYMYVDLEIRLQTVINPGQVGHHPYGIQNLLTIQFFLLGQEENQRIQLGSYQTSHRFNDQIQLTVPAETSNSPPKVQTIVMYEVKANKGRKVIFSFAGSSQEQQEQKNKKIRSLIMPALLKISQSLKLTVENIKASIIVGTGKNRKQLIRVSSSNIDLLLLAYPNGLYMVQTKLGLQIQVPLLSQLVLNVPSIEFYLEAVQQKFIQRMTLKVPKQITVFLTDKIIFDIMETVNKNIKQISSQRQIYSNDSGSLVKEQQNDGFYTSSLNSLLISQIHAKVTVRKGLIQDRENQQKLLDMGFSIIQLEDSGIKLSKVDIEEPINAKHLNNITKEYVMNIIVGCLGGLNLIGNPKQFVQQIQAGTSKGKPVIGFLSGVFAGSANSMSKILSAVGNSVSQLSVDYEYHRERNETYMSHKRGFANGLKQGGKSLFTSLKSGAVGMYKRPKQGLQQEGGIGLIKGTFSGLAGALVKSVTGLIDAASLTARGLKSASSYSQKDELYHRYFQKPLYHRFKIIRPYDKIDQLVYNSLVRIFRQQKQSQFSADIVESCIIQDEHNKATEQAVIITSQKLYVINYEDDKIDVEIPNQKMNATGKFLEGVVLYYNEDDDRMGRQQNASDNGEEIVFRVGSNPIKKQRLYSTLKAFVDLYAQSKDKEDIPE